MSQILKEKHPKLIKSSTYRDGVLEMIDIIRTKSYKYTQTIEEFADIRNRNRVCVMGLYNTEKYGGAYTFDRESITGRLYHTLVKLNDEKEWTFNQIADELERGVSIIR